MSPDLLKYFPALAGLGIVATFYQQFKSFTIKIFRIFWKARIIDEGDLFLLFYKKILDKSLVLNFDDYNLYRDQIFSVKQRKYFPAFFKVFKTELFLYRGFIPIFISGHTEGFKISFLKFSFNFEKFFNSTLKEFYSLRSTELDNARIDRFRIEEIRGRSLKSLGFKNRGYPESEDKPTLRTAAAGSNTQEKYSLYPFGIKKNNLSKRLFHLDLNDIQWSEGSGNPKNKYVFTEKGEYIKNQVERWVKAQNWYEERNINFRRAMLLYGKTGTGKSALILEIAKSLGLPLFVVDLSTFENQEFCEKMDDLSNWPGLIVFEDLDALWDGRTNLLKTDNYGGLTFDCFINKLSGVKSIKNKFVFITTNHKEKLDPALIRAGRIDECIELPSLNEQEKRKVATIILNREDLVNKVVTEGNNDSTAEFENRCVEIALAEFWK